jgi:hypothetical protein
VGGTEALNNPLLAVGAPPDAVAWAALGAAIASAFGAPFVRRWLARTRREVWIVSGLAALAALLSAGYVFHYLRGGPRIIDATSYWLEARALAAGQLSFGIGEPSAAFRGRFLVAPEDGSRLSVIFPPGYPAILAFGFALGAPLAVGPAIAAALVVSTYALGRKLFGRNDIALLAALLATLSAALRYHTADTMAHGWSALLLSLIVLSAWSARGAPNDAKLATACCGLAAGWLFATRPVTAMVGVTLAVALLFSRGPRKILPLFAGMVPGVALLLAHQRAATGSWFGSTQLHYYSLADGPVGCFRYGFGRGIGCLHEHGDFVRARLAEGFGPSEALGATLRRLQHHALDIANFEPLALFLLVALVAAARHPAARWLALAVVMTVLAYVPFYFDGTYPGGGARFYADVLPLEHALVAWILVRLRAVFVAIPLSLLGFATHGVFSHRALAEREGGRPMFEPARLDASGITRGLVWVDTDHGFNLGYTPGRLDAARGVVIARWRGDAHDRALWERLGRPPAYRYRFDPFAARAEAAIEPQRVAAGASWRFEAEAEWPLLAIEGGWARPEHTVACASAGRALRLSPAGASAQATLEVWSPRAAAYDVRIGLAGGSNHRLKAQLGSATWEGSPTTESKCWGLVAQGVWLEPGPHRLRVEASGDDSLLDYVELEAAAQPPH